ncbi:hypothetical protein PTSG_08579 [Salpingoeca rosetta]|uniref:Retinoblastoma-associated protein A-box domain-containing protein n=1 Tax=Salpingoeca rosetta (strain ATCC 50818 / BSB-021) TaxID=946362 RepID=F2UK34_SALR5|nr:uncharacterized protein PTSG_08579 [Salpingoeca rosetta]EGD77483.1 hypothetical protein PTSG_08579 [Salpingoeca rosetta]|eukprot:XP_004990371.1 hypothetical protein PTSG_08579 [Salpingoeca rosetta]
MDKEEYAKFRACCSQLNLDHNTVDRAYNIWLRSRTCFSRDELKSLYPWFACVVYLAIHPDFQTDKSKSAHVHVKGIFQLACMRPEQFYHQLQEFAARANLDKIPQLRRAAQENTVIFHAQTKLKTMEATKICAHYFHDIFEHVFLPALQSPQLDDHYDVDVSAAIALTREFAWTLFLICKAAVPLLLGDISKMFSLLACTMDFVYTNVARFPWISHDALAAYDGDVLAACCSRLKHAEVVGAEQLLRDVHVFFYQSWRPILSSVLEQLKLTSDGPQILRLTWYYRRQRLADSPQKSRQRARDSHASAVQALPRPHELPAAHLSFLRSLSSIDVPESAAAPLEDVFARADQKVTAWVAANALRNSQLFSNFTRIGKALAYKLLSGVIEREFAARGLVRHASSLLQRADVLKTVVALALDLVLFAYKDKTISFPSLVSMLDVDPFDYQQMTEIVVRSNPFLPPVLLARIAACERVCLLDLVWTASHKLNDWFESKPALSSQQTFPRAHSSKTPPPEESTVTAASSSSSSRRAKALAGKKSTRGGKQETRAISTTAWSVLQTRLLSLIQKRLVALTKLLDLPQKSPVVLLAGVAMKHIVQTPRTLQRLALGRHLDTLLLCSLFACVQRFSDTLTMRSIILHYRNMDHASRAAWTAVPSDDVSDDDDADATVDIVEFYNTTFIDVMRDFIESADPMSASPLTAASPSSPSPPSSPSAVSSSSLPSMIRFHTVSKERIDEEGVMSLPADLPLSSNDLNQSQAVRRFNEQLRNAFDGQPIFLPAGSHRSPHHKHRSPIKSHHSREQRQHASPKRPSSRFTLP